MLGLAMRPGLAGLPPFVPGNSFRDAIWIDTAGLGLAAIRFAGEIMATRLQRQTA